MLTEARAVALLMLFTVVAGYTVHREARTFTVCAGACDYHTLSDAVAAVPDGAIIVLRAGSYQENLVLEKRLTIRGQARDRVFIIASSSRGALIQVRGEGRVRLEGVTLIGGRIGVEVRDRAQAVIRRARLANHVRGLALVAGARAILERNEIREVGCAVWAERAQIALHGHRNVIVLQRQGTEVCGAAERLPEGFKS
jgi:nitrous oxidase accessory protein NosD